MAALLGVEVVAVALPKMRRARRMRTRKRTGWKWKKKETHLGWWCTLCARASSTEWSVCRVFHE
jgi:hypothetical protein